MTNIPSRQIVEYRAAMQADRDAKAKARQTALDATLPFSAARMKELLEQGERMNETGASLRLASGNLDVLLQ